MTYLGAIRVWHLLVVSALTGFFVSFEQPVRQSILHDVVPQSDLPNAVTLSLMGSFPFGLIATVIGAPWTVSVCGVLTVLLVGYVMLFRSHLCHARPLGRNVKKLVLRTKRSR